MHGDTNTDEMFLFTTILYVARKRGYFSEHGLALKKSDEARENLRGTIEIVIGERERA